MSIRVLVVDDSALFRKLLQQKLEKEDDIRVVGAAGDAMEARSMIKALDPDVVTLDIEMPGMDGLSFLEKIMTLRPTPVIVVSGSAQEGAMATAKALQLGATHCYAKSGVGRTIRDDDGGELARLVREAAALDFSSGGRTAGATGIAQTNPLASVPELDWKSSPSLIAIGSSTGGVEALHELLADFPSNCPPTVIVQHINGNFSKAIAASLDQNSPARVMTAHHDLKLEPGIVAMAPDNSKHLTIAPSVNDGFRCVLRSDDHVSGHRPSVDVLFDSVATYAGQGATGILLTGMGQDGAKGLLAMAKAGARTIAQDEASCVVFGMPRAAIALGAAREILPLESIAGCTFAYRRKAA
ncbi:MAG: chemotaxis-specific protein-glutamate methyltransferase CheB [Pseudomonadota bacterium]